MSLFNYRTMSEATVAEFVKLYYTADEKEQNAAIKLKENGGYYNFMEAVWNSPLVCKHTFEIVQHIYWAIRILAQPEKDQLQQHYMRTYNPIFQLTSDDYEVDMFTGEGISQTEQMFKKIMKPYRMEQLARELQSDLQDWH